MENAKQELKEVAKEISRLCKAIGDQTKEWSQANRKLDVLNDNVSRLCDKIGTLNQLMQNKS